MKAQLEPHEVELAFDPLLVGSAISNHLGLNAPSIETMKHGIIDFFFFLHYCNDT